MLTSETSVHLTSKETPEIAVKKFKGFSTVEIKALSHAKLSFRFFFYSPQQVANFKDAFLQAFEIPETILE